MSGEVVERRRITVRGTVQGVGFRPFVYRTAVGLGLSGWVGNDSRGVVVEAEGTRTAVDALVHALRCDPPPLAAVEHLEARVVAAEGSVGFGIAPSTAGGVPDVRVSADVAPCDACLREIADPQDRRFAYPFINCTDCGPRYSIVRAVPYDRPATTMAGFEMCARCQAEYDDPADRRFHAQPNACPRCGPQVAWSAAGARLTGPEAVAAAVHALCSGGIVAVKGVGGYHLSCDATDGGAVQELRVRKRRPDKPLAVMVADLEQAGAVCELDGTSRAALSSARRPIVLAPRRDGSGVVPLVAPRLAELGVMLPSSPLHHLLLQQVRRPLVMTSGNRSGEPVLHRDDEAQAVLGPMVCGVLSHDREISAPVDDSVVRSLPRERIQMVRRARGWVPQPLRLPVPAGRPVLAVGAQLKSTVALARGSSVVVSQHLGDLDEWATWRAFAAAVEHLTRLSGIEPQLVAHDLHPDHRSTAWAAQCGLPLLGVQHHHAHIASCLVEHGVTEPVLGIAFDGVGLGSDGTLWGGELLVADVSGFTRVGHLAPVALPGGDAAVREPWRVALSWLHRSLGRDVAAEHGPRLDERWRAVLSLVESGRAPETTSVGRLFDAVAALLGVAGCVTYEGQAAIELEALARAAGGSDRSYPFAVDAGVMDPGPALAALLQDRARGVAVEQVAAGFHRGLAAATARVAVEQASRAGVATVALSGGVFSNVLLSDLLADRLTAAGLQVLRHEQLPPNDGGISVGQAAVAAATLDRA